MKREHRGYNTARGVVNDGGDLYAGCGVGQGSWGSWGDLRYLRLSAVCYMLVISIESTISLILVISCYF